MLLAFGALIVACCCLALATGDATGQCPVPQNPLLFAQDFRCAAREVRTFTRQRTMATYSRVRVRTEEDIERLYTLIMEYLEHPERAATVKEFVFRCDIREEMYLSGSHHAEPWKDAERNRDVSRANPMYEAVQCLDLGEQQDDFVKILTWMEPDLLTTRKAAIYDDPESYKFEPYVRRRDFEFAHRATALLLMLCPNIERLTYEDNFSPVFEILSRNNYGRLPHRGLQKLRHVHLLHTGVFLIADEREYNHMDLLSMLRLVHRLPALETVSTAALDIHGGADHELYFPPATSNVTHIHVLHSVLPGSIMGSLIRASKRLEELTLTTGGRNSLHGGFWSYQPKTIGKALASHRSSLRKLDLDLDAHIGQPYEDDEDEDEHDEDIDYGPDEDEHMENNKWWPIDKIEMQHPLRMRDIPDDRPYNGTLGSLHDFIALKSLSVGVETLLGPPRTGDAQSPDIPFRLIDALPKSLEHLLLRGYVKGKVHYYDDQVQGLLDLKSARLSALAVVEGVDEVVPGGEDVDRPDDHPELLWEPDEEDDGWVIATA